MFGVDDPNDNNDDNQTTDNSADDLISQQDEPSTAPAVEEVDHTEDKTEDQKAEPPEDKTEDEPADSPKPPVTGNQDALLEIKRSALQELSPLLGELNLPPDEKFRTTMMMIQAFDDQKLIGEAYEAAKKIKDRKERAEALLDIVNEINYFTQGSSSKED